MAIRLGGGISNSPENSAAAAGSAPVPQTTNTPAPADFTRYIGYDDKESFETILTDIYINTKKNGMFFDKTIPNPASPEVSKISETADIPNEPNKETIRSILNSLQSASLLDLSKIGSKKTTDEAAQLIESVLEDLKSGQTSPNSIKNALIKFICWLIRYSTFELQNILYIGQISKHEVMWLYLLSLLGCKVTYVNYTSEQSYLEGDKSGKYSNLVKGSVFTPLSLNLGRINVAEYTQKAQAKEQLNAITAASSPVMLKYLTTEHEYISKDILSTLDLRQAKMLCTDTTIPLYFTAYVGYDEESQYNNMLFSMKEELTSQKKQFILIEELRKPSYEEAGDYYSIQKTNDASMLSKFASMLSIRDNIGRTVLVQKAFIDTINRIQTNNLYNTAVQLAVWFKKITSQFDFFQSDIPMIVYYGNITAVEMYFLGMMSRSGIDVFYFNPDKSILPLINQLNIPDLQVIERKESKSSGKFPDRMIKTTLATNAYNAEKSLDSILYNDNTMFRTHQFSVSRNQTLRTTYEELGIMWHQQSMFRTGFDSKNDYVIVPNLFAKISGVPKGDIQAYYKDIAFKLSPMSVYFSKIPFFKPVSPISRDVANQFCRGKKIDIEALKTSQLNKYNYMNDSMQYLIYSKMQEVIDSGFITVPDSDIVPLVMTTVFNIPNNLLQILQRFDFTKDVPKIVIVSSGKTTFEAFECILLVLFNLIGFDIIVYTPTGYKNLESFIRPEAFQEFNMGDFEYKFVPQSLRIPKEIPQEKVSFFDRIFKGKK